MSAFSSAAFSTSAFSVNAFSFDNIAGELAASGTIQVFGEADLDARGKLEATAGLLSISGFAGLGLVGTISAAGTLSITGFADINVNLPPFWAGGNNKVFRFTVGTGTDTIDFTPFWTDPENDPIVDYQLVVFESLPAGWSLDPVTGIMTVTIDTAASHTGWAMSAEDDHGGIGLSAEFSILVVDVTVVTFRFEVT